MFLQILSIVIHFDYYNNYICSFIIFRLIQGISTERWEIDCYLVPAAMQVYIEIKVFDRYHCTWL